MSGDARSPGVRPRFPLFDSLRAIAALAIFGYHLAFTFGWFSGEPLSPWFAQLNVGVPIFFVISGFLLYRPFVRARVLGTPRPALGPYALRRFLRIVPAYWVALALIAVWLGETSEVFSPGGVLTYFGFAQSYRVDTFAGGIGQAWTLNVEILFYALLPLWAWLAAHVVRARPVGGELGALVLLVAVGVGWKVVLLLVTSPQDRGALVAIAALPGWLDVFAVGMGIAVVSVWAHERRGRHPVIEQIDRRPWIAWAVALGAFALLGVTDELGDRSAQLLVEHGLKALVAAGLVLPAVFGDPARGWVRRILGAPPLLWIGLVSYGFYLWHVAVIDKLARAGLRGEVGWLGLSAAALAGSLAIAAVSWYLLERPILRLGRRLAGPTAQTRTLEEDRAAIVR